MPRHSRLLESLKGLQFHRKNPLVLCNVKPGNIMLRMSSEASKLSKIAYLERLAETRPKGTGTFEDYRYDSPENEVRLRQCVYSRLNPSVNTYLDP